jgi:hypothetical protein
MNDYFPHIKSIKRLIRTGMNPFEKRTLDGFQENLLSEYNIRKAVIEDEKENNDTY